MSWTTAVDDARRLLSDGPTDRIRHRKIRLSNREIDRIFQFRAQVEHPPNAGGVDRASAVGNQFGDIHDRER